MLWLYVKAIWIADSPPFILGNFHIGIRSIRTIYEVGRTAENSRDMKNCAGPKNTWSGNVETGINYMKMTWAKLQEVSKGRKHLRMLVEVSMRMKGLKKSRDNTIIES